MKLNKIIKEVTFINLKDVSIDEIIEIRQIRNNNQIRMKMTNSKIISNKDHLKWYHEMLNSKINFFFIIKYKDQIVGGLGLKNYNNKFKVAEWSFYISPEKNFIGFGATIEFKALDFLFREFELNKLYCYVLGHNLEVIKLHHKFGFNEINFEKYISSIHVEKNIKGTVYFSLEKNKWEKHRKLIYDKYF